MVSGDSRGGLDAGRSVADFGEGLVFVLPGKGDVFVDGFDGAVDVLGGSVEVGLGDDSVVELGGTAVGDEQVFDFSGDVVDDVGGGFVGFDKVEVFVRSVGDDVLGVAKLLLLLLLLLGVENLVVLRHLHELSIEQGSVGDQIGTRSGHV